MTREQAYLQVVEGWLRVNRGIVFTEGAVDDLCDRVAAEIGRLTSERNDYEAEGRRHIKTIAELRHEKERLYINVADRNKELARWQHDALGWSDRLTEATAEIKRLEAVVKAHESDNELRYFGEVPL